MARKDEGQENYEKSMEKKVLKEKGLKGGKDHKAKEARAMMPKSKPSFLVCAPRPRFITTATAVTARPRTHAPQVFSLIPRLACHNTRLPPTIRPTPHSSVMRPVPLTPSRPISPLPVSTGA